MNIKEIKELLELMAEHNVSEIEIEKDNTKIKLRKLPNGKFVMDHAPAMAQGMAPLQAMLPPAQAPATDAKYAKAVKAIAAEAVDQAITTRDAFDAMVDKALANVPPADAAHSTKFSVVVTEA